MANLGFIFATPEFVNHAKKVHGDRYDYSESNFVAKSRPIMINCRQHGPFQQIVSRHLMGKGCPKCAMEQRSNETSRLTTEEFIRRSKAEHGSTYDYSKTVYKGTRNDVTIICSIHGEFRQKAGQHISGVGCPACGSRQRVKWLFNKG